MAAGAGAGDAVVELGAIFGLSAGSILDALRDALRPTFCASA